MLQLPTYGLGVVRLVAQDGLGSPSWSAGPSGDGRDAIDQVEGLGDVVDVDGGRDDVQRGALTVSDQVVRAARLPPVNRVALTLCGGPTSPACAGSAQSGQTQFRSEAAPPLARSDGARWGQVGPESNALMGSRRADSGGANCAVKANRGRTPVAPSFFART